MNYKLRNTLTYYVHKVDLRIFLVFSTSILIGLLLLYYKYSKQNECNQINFEIIAENNQVGESIKFKDLTPGAKNWVWDFGDYTEKKKDQYPVHTYENPGTYIVTLHVNGTCKLQKTIEINPGDRITDSLKIPKIIVPSVVRVDEPLDIYYEYIGEAFSWEWSFGESGQMDSTKEYPVYSYSLPGKKRLTLVINGDMTHIASKDIIVIPKKLTAEMYKTYKENFKNKNKIVYTLPPGKTQKDPFEEFLESIPFQPMESSSKKSKTKTENTSAPSISENQFELLLLDVSKQTKTMEDFGKYTCNKYEFPVIHNNEIITFSEFCKKIKNKKIKIKSLRLVKNKKNCIESIILRCKIKKTRKM